MPRSTPCDRIRTPRFELRLLDGSPRHAALFHSLYTCPQVMARIAPPLDQDAASAAYGRVCRHNTAVRPGSRYWAIESARGPAGIAALVRDGARAEAGVMLLPSFWRQGVAMEAVHAVVDAGFERMGLASVFARSQGGAHGAVMHRIFDGIGFHPVDPGPDPLAQRRWHLARDRWAAVRAGRAVPLVPGIG